MIAAAVHGVLAQRLVRRVCTDCAQPTQPTPNQIGLAWRVCRPTSGGGPAEVHVAGAGCTYCNLSGYRGRVAVYELLEINRPLADAVRRGDLEGFARAARSSWKAMCRSRKVRSTWPCPGSLHLAEAMAVGSGLEEILDADRGRAVGENPASSSCWSSGLNACRISGIAADQGAVI